MRLQCTDTMSFPHSVTLPCTPLMHAVRLPADPDHHPGTTPGGRSWACMEPPLRLHRPALLYVIHERACGPQARAVSELNRHVLFIQKL